MKIYNPFKPHIVEFQNGKFAVRRYEFLCWTYKGHTIFPRESESHWWFVHEYVVKHCMVDTLEEAKVVMNLEKPKVKKVDEFDVKVIHG